MTTCRYAAAIDQGRSLVRTAIATDDSDRLVPREEPADAGAPPRKVIHGIAEWLELAPGSQRETGP